MVFDEEQNSILVANATGDCDGDGDRDDGYGLLCQTTPEWWSPVGSMRCGLEGLECSVPGALGEVEGDDTNVTRF